MDLSLTIIAPTLPHTHTIIFLHGRGGTTQKFAQTLLYSKDSLNRSLPEAFPFFRFVFPGPKTPQWFDIYNTSDFGENEEVQIPGLKASVIAVRKKIEEEVELLDGKWENLVLAGISQGAAVGVHTLVNLNVQRRMEDGMEVGGRL